MKKFTKVFATGFLALSLVACGNSNGNASNGSGSEENGEVVKIGMIQYVEHVALDRATEGFRDAMLNEGDLVDGENAKYIFHNAQADQGNCETIANTLVNENPAIIFANATPAAQAVAAKTSDIPIVVTSVTDPATSGLVESNDAPGTNVTGTSDLTPVKEQIDLLTQLLPEAKTVGLLYTGSEDNSIFQAGLAKEAIEAKGLTVSEYTVTDSASIQSVVESMIGKVDVVYIPTDNLLAEGMANVTQITTANKLPVIVGEVGMVENGGLATYGIDYYNLGYLTGEMALNIIKNGEDPSTMAIQYLPANECELSINKSVAEELGIEIPSSLQEKAKFVE